MDRLTELHHKKSDGYYIRCSEHCNDICDCNCEKWGEVVDRLGAYEDTGLEPEEVEQIKRAAVYMMFEDVAHFVRYTLSNFDELQKYKALGDYNRLCELKQADDEGRCVVLPCKVGDTVYRVVTPTPGPPLLSEMKITTMKQAASLVNLVGKHKLVSYYLTREDAEAALKEG